MLAPPLAPHLSSIRKRLGEDTFDYCFSACTRNSLVDRPTSVDVRFLNALNDTSRHIQHIYDGVTLYSAYTIVVTTKAHTRCDRDFLRCMNGQCSRDTGKGYEMITTVHAVSGLRVHETPRLAGVCLVKSMTEHVARRRPPVASAVPVAPLCRTDFVSQVLAANHFVIAHVLAQFTPAPVYYLRPAFHPNSGCLHISVSVKARYVVVANL